ALAIVRARRKEVAALLRNAEEQAADDSCVRPIRVLAAGRPELEPLLDSAELARTAPAEARLLDELAPFSRLAVPVPARDSTVGAITLVSAENGRRFGPSDLALVEELGR